ncbi:hypothetical protein [Azohydromonas lata]|nr:hypothetical protein [Azohydromonas lata]
MNPRRALLALVAAAYAAVACWHVNGDRLHKNTHLSSKERGHANQA